MAFSIWEKNIYIIYKNKYEGKGKNKKSDNQSYYPQTPHSSDPVAFWVIRRIKIGKIILEWKKNVFNWTFGELKLQVTFLSIVKWTFNWNESLRNPWNVNNVFFRSFYNKNVLF